MGLQGQALPKLLCAPAPLQLALLLLHLPRPQPWLGQALTVTAPCRTPECRWQERRQALQALAAAQQILLQP